MTDADEYTPHELGMKLGHTWAEMAPMRGSQTEVATVADTGAVPDNVRQLALSGMSDRLKGRDDERAFMDGFVHGVRAFVVSGRTGETPN
jgi:hypothetical protein